jgi:hypothetical protein
MNAKVLRKHATSLVLVAAALGLGAYVWFVDRDKPSTQETEARKDNLLPILRRDDISEIGIEHDGRKATIKRQEEGDAGDYMFHLVEGDAKLEDSAYADQISVEKLIQALEFATRLRKMEDDFDVGSAGLNPPQVRLTIRMGSVTYGLAVGSEAKTPSGSRYAALEGHGVFVIPASAAADMIRPIEAYRTRRIIPFTSTELASIEVQGERGLVRIDRGSWGGFRIENVAGKPRVSKVAFDRMLRAFADATAERFLESAQAEQALGTAKDPVSLALVSKSGDRVEFRLGGACPGGSADSAADSAVEPSAKLVVMIRKGPVPLSACVPSSVLADLQVPATAFVDQQVLGSAPDEVEEFSIVRGEATLELARKGSGWHARKPEDRDLPGEDVRGYLAALLAIEGTIVPDPDLAKLGLEPPRGTITLRHPSVDTLEAPPRIVEIGAETTSPEGPSLALRRKEDGVVLLVPAVLAKLFEPTMTMIRSTELLRVNSQRVQRVELTLADGQRRVLQRKGAGFALEEPKGYAVDSTLAADIFDAVGNLRAERWVADRDDGSFGLESPAMSLRVEFEGESGQETRTLRIGSPTPEGRYARWEKDTGVFVVSRSLDMVFRTYPIDRTVFMVDPSVVRALTIRVSGKDLRISATGDVWRTAGGSTLELSEPALVRLRQALIELRAEGVVHLGPPLPEEGMSKPLVRIEVEHLPGFRTQNTVFSIGRSDVWGTMNVHYARREGTDATFAIAQSKVRPILEVLGPVEP